MKFTGVAFLASLATLLGRTAAQSTTGLQILAPGGDGLWWVADSINTLLWSCSTSPYTNFTVLIGNTNTSILTQPLPIIAQQPNYDCSVTIGASMLNVPVGGGYFIQFGNPFNSTDVYTQSEPFAIEADGSAYPASSATPTAASSSTSGSGSSTGSSGAAATGSSGSSSSSNGAISVQGAMGSVAALAAAVGMLFV